MSTPDIQNSPYSEYLEEIVKMIYEEQPLCIGIVARLPDGCTAKAYYSCTPEDKGVMAYHMLQDSVYDVILNNIEDIRSALEGHDPREDEDDGEEENGDAEA